VTGFVTRSGRQLLLDGHPYYFTGINIYNANSVNNYWYTLGTGSGLDQALTDIGPDVKVMRAWFGQWLANPTGAGIDWSIFDHTISVAAAHGFKVIVTFADQDGTWDDGIRKTIESNWYQSGYKTQVSNVASTWGAVNTMTYKDFVGTVVNRYKNDSTVLMWQLVNEAEPKNADGTCPTATDDAGRDALRAFADDMGAYVKGLDPNHLLSLGSIGSGQCGMSGDRYGYVHASPYIDLLEMHDYVATTNGLWGDAFNGVQKRLNDAAALNKPLFFGESGMDPSDPAVGGTTARASMLKQKWASQFNAGAVGIVAWEWRNAGQTGGDQYVIPAGDPAVASLRLAQYVTTSTAYRDSVTADTPVAWWHLDETSGSTFVEAVAARNATITGTPTLGVAALSSDGDKAAAFATTSLQYADAAANAAFRPTTLTVEVLIKSAGATGNNRIVQFGADESWQLLIEGGLLKFTVQNKASATWAWPGDNNPHHVAGTYNGTGLAILYVDGVEVGREQGGGTGAPAATTNPLRIAGKPTSTAATDGWNGTLDEVAVYGTALAAARVAAHAAAAGLSSGGAGVGSVTFWAGTGGYSNSAGLSVATSLPAGTTAGDLVFIVVNHGNADVVYTAPAGWTLAVQHSNFQWSNINSAVFYRVIRAGDTAPTVTFQGGVGAADKFSWAAAAFRPGAGGTLSVDNGGDPGVFTDQGTTKAVDARTAVAVEVASVIFTGNRNISTGATAVTVTPPANWLEAVDVSTNAGTAAGQEQINSAIFYRTILTGTIAPGAYTVSAASSANVWHYLIKETGGGGTTQTGAASLAATATGTAAATVDRGAAASGALTAAGTAGTTGAKIQTAAAAGGATFSSTAAASRTATGGASLASTAASSVSASTITIPSVGNAQPFGRNAVGLRGVTSLLVRIGRGVASRAVTVPLPDDAEITWAAPGGDDTFSCTIDWPDRGIARPDAFTQNMPVRVEDRRTGEVIWQGRIADPGFSGDRSRQQFHLNAVGSGHDLDMISVVKNYVDRDPEHWFDTGNWPSGVASRGDGTGFIPSVHDSLQIEPEYYIELPWPTGTFMASGAVQAVSYWVGLFTGRDLLAADGSASSYGTAARVPEVHGIRYSWITSFANANDVRLIGASPDTGSSVQLLTQAWTTGGQNHVSVRDGLAAWTRDDFTHFQIDNVRTGGNITSSGGDGYLRIANIHVIGKRYNRYGVDVSGVRIEALAPYEIFEDMLGTILNGRFDPGTITPDGSILIDQAAWWEATPVSDILDAAKGWNNDAWWGVWAPANPDALPRLDYRAWNVGARYTLDDTANVSLAGGAEGWANSALITYLRGSGVPTTTRGTVTVPAISRIFGSSGVGTLAVRTRDLSIDLTDRGAMTRAKALEVAGQMLHASATDRLSGSTTVRAPIIDDSTGRLVQPWEIRPGWPIIVGSTPNQFTSGSPTRFDGESTFRLTKVSYRASDDTATLELDGGTRRLVRGGPASTPAKYSYVRWANRRRK
jgi:mannan endo-1,4-beta-mannosidase